MKNTRHRGRGYAGSRPIIGSGEMCIRDRERRPNIEQTYVLLGAYRDGNPDTGELNTVPVLFQIKEFIPETQANKLLSLIHI